MSQKIEYRVNRPAQDGDDTPANGTIECRPLRRRYVDHAVVLPAAFRAPLVDGVAELQLAEPDPQAWCWVITERCDRGIQRNVLFTEVGGTIYADDLVDVDPETFDPVPNIPTVQQAIDAEAQAREDADDALDVRLTEVESGKADAADVYTKTATDSLLAAKANSSDVYSKSEADNLLDEKANSADVYGKTEVYTKTEADGLLGDKLDSADLDASVAADVADDGSDTAAAVDARIGATEITVGPSGRQFTQIQDAIDSITDDSPTKRYVIVVDRTANGATYQRFSMVGWPYLNGHGNNRLRYISIIARDGSGVVTVKDTTGDYRIPPAEIRTDGIVKGIRFIATHDTPFTDPTEAALSRRSYAVHLDWGSEDVVFEDCDLISEHAPGAGIGLHQNETITFRRCRISNLGDGSYGGLKDYGAIYCHSSTSDGVTGQRLILDDTVLSSLYGSRGLWADAAGSFVGCGMSIQANRTTIYSPGTLADVDSRILIEPGSGNNATNLNVTAAAEYEGLSLPGAATDYVRTADASHLDITGDLEIIWRGALTDWTTGAFQGLVGKWNTTGNQRSYGLLVNGTGAPFLTWSVDGTSGTQLTRTSTSALSTSDGDPVWIKATLDVNNGASGHDVKFYTSSNGTTWTQLGSTVTTSGTTSVYASTAPLQVGLWASFPSAGIHSTAIVKNGIGGAIAAQWDARTPSASVRDIAGNEWTIIGTGSSWVSA